MDGREPAEKLARRAGSSRTGTVEDGGLVQCRPQHSRSRSWKAHLQTWYRIIFLEFILRQRTLPPSKDGRRIRLQLVHETPLVDERRGHAYVSNTIRTSRYTVYDFFPKQLIFQFTRLGNFYFLCVGVPQTVPGLSTTGNFTTILPLLFFVLLTIAKEGYDDYRRHRLDKVENANCAAVLKRKKGKEGLVAVAAASWIPARWQRKPVEHVIPDDEEFDGARWTTTQWHDIQVGDIVLLSRDEAIPADVVLLHADGENGLAYIETMALDGETNLKSKQVSTALAGCDTIKGLSACDAEFVLEDPNPDLYRFDGRVTVDGKTLPLTLLNVIYRGSILRNTPRAIGLVVNTGEECKISLNANQHPDAKRPALERMANKIVITLAIYVITLSVGCSMGYLIWQDSTERWLGYLTGAAVAFHEIIIGYIIQFNNVIPLALYVSLEIVKIGQMLMLNSDVEMYDEASDTPMRCNTNTILENLGQVGYVFTDKTGTLTENVMKFRKMSIAGTAWLHEADLGDEVDMSIGACALSKGGGAEAAEAASEMGTVHSPEEPRPRRSQAAETTGRPSFARRSSSHWRSTGRPDLAQPEVTTRDLLEFIRLRPDAPFSRKAKDYLLAMALCHTCLPEIQDGHLDYQAASPDELALVRAAREVGYVVAQRSSQSITLRIAGQEETFEILDVIEFSSKRKRMSIIVRYPDGRIAVICKGADSVILPRLAMAHLATQKAAEARQSADLEREMLRKSEQLEIRNSFGGRPSLSVRRSLGVPRGAGGPSRPRPTPQRSQSFEPGKLSVSGGRPFLTVTTRTVSFDTPTPPSRLPRSPMRSQAPVPDRFAFLDEPSVCDDGVIFSQCFRHLEEFATEGLRTLLFGQRFVSETDYLAWKEIYQDATTSLVDRQDRIEAAAEVIEQGLDLVGASAIEDKLQAGVPETIEKLRRANIKIWMLTGDKRETAINIAHSARICRPGSELFVLDAAKGSLDDQLVNIAEEIQLGGLIHSVVVIDGHTLSTVEASPCLAERFYAVMPLVDSVICCRASPAQKALLVHTVRSRLHSRRTRGRMNRGLTLAIGDGANDLAMISASHVGVGISGHEGLQAARVADYAIAQFRFLQRLLLVHGRWNYVRTAKFVLCTFWKEMFFYLPTALYQRYNGYTGTSLYEMASLTVFNTLFTSLCVICMGIWEQDLRAETLLAVPELYVYGQRNMGLNLSKYTLWMIGAAVEGVMAWFGVWAGYVWFATESDQGLFAVGDLAFSVGVVWINWKLFIMETHHKSSIVLGSFFITVAGWWAWNAFLSGVYALSPSPYAVRDGFKSTFGPDPVWWLTLIVVVAVFAIIEVVVKAVRRNLVVAGLWKWPPWGRRESLSTNVEEWDVELWQEMEQDEAIREKLKLMSRAEDGTGDNVNDDAANERWLGDEDAVREASLDLSTRGRTREDIDLGRVL